MDENIVGGPHQHMDQIDLSVQTFVNLQYLGADFLSHLLDFRWSEIGDSFVFIFAEKRTSGLDLCWLNAHTIGLFMFS